MSKIKASPSAKPKAKIIRLRRNRRAKKRSDESSSTHPLLQLQQTIGNQAVARLIQTKLKVGKPGDKSEQQADRVADTVMKMPDSQIQRQPQEEKKEELRAQPAEKEEELKRQPEEEKKEETVTSKEISGHTPTVTPKIQANIQNMRGSGKPLPGQVRNFFEPRFDYDFSQVRVHHDTQAAETADKVKAKAFTVGQDVVFGSGQYDPKTSKGRKLLAHELTHVVQQLSGRQKIEIQAKPKSAKSQPRPKPAQTIYEPYKHEAYKIEGATLKEVAQNIELRDEAGRTDCQIEFHGDTDADGKHVKAKVIVKITITMPVWSNYKSQSKAAKAEWDRAYNALKVHENGHVKIMEERTKDFAAQLIGLTEEESNQALADKIKELEQANDKYNQETDYGKKQGTIIDTTIK